MGKLEQIPISGMILESFLDGLKNKMKKPAHVIYGRTRVLTDMLILEKGMKEMGGGKWPYCFFS